MVEENNEELNEEMGDSVNAEPEQGLDNVEGSECAESGTEKDDGAPDLQAQLDTLAEELTQAKDQALRAAAEVQNVRRRAENDVESAHKFALKKFCEELLPVVDNLERAQQSAGVESNEESSKALVEGVDLTLKSFIDVLAKFKLECLDPVGEPFNPDFHQAITMIENPESEPNTVLDVMQKGYTLNGRLLRPAMVVVSKA